MDIASMSSQRRSNRLSIRGQKDAGNLEGLPTFSIRQPIAAQDQSIAIEPQDTAGSDSAKPPRRVTGVAVTRL